MKATATMFRRFPVLFAVLLPCCFAAVLRAADAPTEPSRSGVIDLPMYFDPALEGPEVSERFHPRLKLLWLQALGRPESEFRRSAAEAFNAAAREGMTGWEEVLPALMERLASDPDVSVRLAAAGALASIDDPAAAAAMLDADRAAASHTLVLLTDPALARWGHEPAAALWIERLADRAALTPVRVSAAESLGVIQHTAAAEPLLAVVMSSDEPAELRLVAARALGAMVESGLVDEAQTLAQGALVDRMAAAEMLASHPAGEASGLLMQLGGDAMPTVAAAAARSLNAIDPSLIAAAPNAFLTHADPLVRGEAVEALAATPTAGAAPLLAARLDDPTVKVRHLARQTLLAYAREHGFDAEVRAAATASLHDAGWRGIEQAAILLGDLDHEPAADRLVTLLTHERPEVRLAAATALRELAVPATLPALLQRAETLTSEVRAALDSENFTGFAQIGHETAQLFQAFGQMEYAPAESLMRQYIPKGSGFEGSARAAAIYALGRIHEGELVEDLARQFGSRVSDIDPMNPELTEVRRFSAIALGRMGAQGQLGVLQRFYRDENSSEDIGGATRWAIIRITGEELPPLESLVYNQTGWFLEPTN